MLKNQQSAFVLAEALMSLILISLAVAFEYEQVQSFQRQDAQLKKQFQNTLKEREIALQSWHDYVEK